MSIKFPSWLPIEIVEWLKQKAPSGGGKFGQAMNDLLQTDMFPNQRTMLRLALDSRMCDVWEWFQSGRPWTTKKVPIKTADGEWTIIDQETPLPHAFFITMSQSTRLPQKPGNMPPKTRAAYLDKVRKHAVALIDLLEDTKFDRSVEMNLFMHNLRPIAREKVGPTIEEDLFNSFQREVNEDGYPWHLAYVVDDNEAFRAPWNYPESELVATLQQLVMWSEQDDYFDYSPSINPIRQAGIRGQKAYFLANLYRRLNDCGLSMPFEHYATITNIALDLPEPEELDEDSARKQIHRMLERGDIEEPKQTVIDSDGSLPF